MEKRYQVFISSTFQDLQGARQEVSQALLRAGCFPAGMELFPAADEEQFEFIKTVIDQSDYYIIISAGRYGSIHPETGLSYTEMEYDYAVETGKPVIRLLHKDPKSISDEGDNRLIKLLQFIEKMKSGRMVAFWKTPAELGRETVYALLEAIKTKPTLGWVRADCVATEDLVADNLRLRNELSKANEGLESLSEFLGFDDFPYVQAIIGRESINKKLLNHELSKLIFRSFDGDGYVSRGVLTKNIEKYGLSGGDASALVAAMFQDHVIRQRSLYKHDVQQGNKFNEFVNLLALLNN